MQYKLFDAEKKFMDIIWDTEPVNSTELCRVALAALGWKKSTTYSMIRRLCDRGILKNENATVTAMVSRDEMRHMESEALIRQEFKGSVPLFLASYLNGRKLTAQEAEDIRRMIEEAE